MQKFTSNKSEVWMDLCGQCLLVFRKFTHLCIVMHYEFDSTTVQYGSVSSFFCNIICIVFYQDCVTVVVISLSLICETSSFTLIRNVIH